MEKSYFIWCLTSGDISINYKKLFQDKLYMSKKRFIENEKITNIYWTMKETPILASEHRSAEAPLLDLQ